MFTDEIYESLLKNGEKLTTAHIEAVEQKRESDGSLSFLSAKQIENGYQLFRKRHSEYPENSFRRFLWVRLVNSGYQDTAERLFSACGWKQINETEL